MKTIKVFLLTLLLSVFLNTVSAQEHEGHEPKQADAVHAGDHVSHPEDGEQKAGATIWTCSMHPQIHLPKPGKCPLCHMDLIPVAAGHGGDDESSASSLTLSERAKILSEIEESVVERKWVTRDVRLVGTINYDESRVKHITAWVPGRIQRMFVDYTGIQVNEDDHMLTVYSPELISAQEELIQGARSLGRIGKGGSDLVKTSTRRTLSAAREKLKLLGLSGRQVKQIEQRGSAEDDVVIYAPMNGTVVEKHVSEGMYVKEGTRLYTVADLTHLWLTLDAFESDLSWISYGQEVSFRAAALPGEEFGGIVSFVQPFLDSNSRTVEVRVNVANTDKRLKPGMFVTANVQSQVDSEATLITPSFFGKYICPMHPEVVSDEKGSCSICGMTMLEAEELPFVGGRSKRGSKPPLVIPASAPLLTGERAVVYVKDPTKNTYQGREIELGPKAGKHYVVMSGLEEGEIVVSRGAFTIDADLQIRGSQSMMNPVAGSALTGHSGH